MFDLESACRTIVDLSAHMHRLRAGAIEFQQTFGVRQRGYFTPSEDDQVLHLWVSYHKARNALLELIDGIRKETQNVADAEGAEFLCAYAAATILVDAARCLRDLFTDDRVIRRKLNESFELYGIHRDSFDAVQMSLTAPGHAKQLNEANIFFAEHRDALQLVAEEQPILRPVIEVIEQRLAAVRVGPGRYIRARLAERRRDLRDRMLAGGLAQIVYVIQEWGSRVVSGISTQPGHIAKVPDVIASALLSRLQPGDVLITRKNAAFTNYFLPGYWPHAAFYIGEEQVIESLKDGVRVRSMDSPFGNDALAVIRPQLQADSIREGVERAHRHVGKPYDFDFDFTRSDRLVCTEVVYRGLEGLGGIAFQLSKRAGRQTLSAEDLLGLALQEKRFSPVAAYCPQHHTEILEAGAMCDLLRRTMTPA